MNESTEAYLEVQYCLAEELVRQGLPIAPQIAMNALEAILEARRAG